MYMGWWDDGCFGIEGVGVTARSVGISLICEEKVMSLPAASFRYKQTA